MGHANWSLLVVLVTAPSSLGAQWLLAPPPALSPRIFVGGGISGAQPVGDFARNVDFGYGAGGHVVHALGGSRAFALRVGVDMLTYGRESEQVPLSTSVPRIRVDVTTSNNILAAGIGPQLMLPDGRLRPYVGGTIGFSYFYTQSSIGGSDGYYEFANTTHHDDWALAWTGTGGLYVPLRRGVRPISLDFSATYHGNGKVRYLREGSITEDGSGNLLFDPIESDANLIVYRVGVTFGVH